MYILTYADGGKVGEYLTLSDAIDTMDNLIDINDNELTEYDDFILDRVEDE